MRKKEVSVDITPDRKKRKTERKKKYCVDMAKDDESTVSAFKSTLSMSLYVSNPSTQSLAFLLAVLLTPRSLRRPECIYYSG